MSGIGGKDGVIGRANLWIADDFWVLRFRLMVETRSALSGLMHQKEKRSMDHFAGLDVSVKETSVCIVDETGKIVREVKVTSEPEAMLAVLRRILPTTLSELAWKPGRCRSGCSALSPKPSYLWSVLKPGTCKRC